MHEQPDSNATSTGVASRFRVFVHNVKEVTRRPLFAYGVPFFGALLVGTGVLTLVQQEKFRQVDKKVRKLSAQEKLEAVNGRQKPYSIQEEYMRLSGIDVDNWKQVRVPRPPETE